MSKTFTNNPITNELKGSAWFQRPATPLPESTPAPASTAKPTANQPASKPQVQEAEPTDASKLASKLASKNASMLAIAPFSDDDLKALRQSTYNQLNVRGTEAEVEWLKDIAYQLSKEVKPNRVNQQDVIRVGMRLFEKFMDTNKAELIRILKEIK
jgi:hypothetical protein